MLINEDHIWIRRLSFIMSIYDLDDIIVWNFLEVFHFTNFNMLKDLFLLNNIKNGKSINKFFLMVFIYYFLYAINCN